MDLETEPLVSIGIPTYNRASCLIRAVESALAQDYPNVEIIVSDNASTDQTSDICAELCKQDHRLRYVRQPTNCGMTENFRRVLAESRGKYFMWLSDDDWLDPTYISQCVRFLSDNNDYTLVCGGERYYEHGDFVVDGDKINLSEDSRTARVLGYYRQVGTTNAFYGVAKLDLLRSLSLKHVLGGDWLFTATVAYLGKIKTLETTSIHRSITGASQDLERLSLNMGLSRFKARNAELVIAASVLSDIAWRSQSYASAAKLARLFLGIRAASAIILRLYLPPRVYPAKERIHERIRTHAQRIHRLLDRHLLWRFHRRSGRT